jgi:hypothetical protein
VTLEFGGRRLAHAAGDVEDASPRRRLAGSVQASYTIVVPSGSGTNVQGVLDAVAAADAAKVTSLIVTAVGGAYTVQVTSFSTPSMAARDPAQSTTPGGDGTVQPAGAGGVAFTVAMAVSAVLLLCVCASSAVACFMKRKRQAATFGTEQKHAEKQDRDRRLAGRMRQGEKVDDKQVWAGGPAPKDLSEVPQERAVSHAVHRREMRPQGIDLESLREHSNYPTSPTSALGNAMEGLRLSEKGLPMSHIEVALPAELKVRHWRKAAPTTPKPFGPSGGRSSRQPEALAVGGEEVDMTPSPRKDFDRDRRQWNDVSL